MLEALKKSLSGDGQLDYMDAQNVIIVHDTQQVHESIRTSCAVWTWSRPGVFIDVSSSPPQTPTSNLGVNYGDGGPQDLRVRRPDSDQCRLHRIPLTASRTASSPTRRALVPSRTRPARAPA
ncbi:MAG: hypothetical protein R3E96_04370 [Planctomycetota bacterium]